MLRQLRISKLVLECNFQSFDLQLPWQRGGSHERKPANDLEPLRLFVAIIHPGSADMNVRTAITRKEQESDQAVSGGLSWATVHEFNSQHASSVKAAAPHSGNLITAGRTGLQLWDVNTGKYALQCGK